MLNPLTGAYASLIKFGIVLTLVVSLIGAYKYKIHEAVQKANTISELRHKDEILAQKEVLFIKKRAAEKELEKDFAKRQGVNDEKIKRLNSYVSALLTSLQQRPPRPVSTSGNTASSRTESSTTGATGKELYEPDARFLVGIASEAETLKLGLIQCYADYDSVKKSIDNFVDKK